MNLGILSKIANKLAPVISNIHNEQIETNEKLDIIIKLLQNERKD